MMGSAQPLHQHSNHSPLLAVQLTPHWISETITLSFLDLKMPTPTPKNHLAAELLRDALLEIRHEARKSRSRKIEKLADLVNNIPTALVEDRFDVDRFLKHALKFRSEFTDDSLFDYALRAREMKHLIKTSKPR
jgi:hypothetical protein